MSGYASGGGAASGGAGMNVPPSPSSPSSEPIEIGVQISSHMGFILTDMGGYFKTTALTRESSTPHPGLIAKQISSPYDFIDVITFATAAPGFYSTAQVAQLLKPIFKDLYKTSEEFHQSKFPPFNLTGAALIRPEDVIQIVKQRTIYFSDKSGYAGYDNALTISSYIPNKKTPDQTLTGYLSFIGSSEHEELVKIGGIHDLETDAKYGYDSVLDINTNIPFIVDDHTRARIKATRIATFEEMIPFLVNFFTHIYGGRTVKLKLYFTGCGKIGQLFTKEAGEGGIHIRS